MGSSFLSKIYSKRILWAYYIIRNFQFYGIFWIIINNIFRELSEGLMFAYDIYDSVS
jgi:hypothetical protein